jgi:GH3 auxin-responsive promoter
MHNLASSQEGLLHSLLRENCDSAFGVEHGFSSIQTVEQYRSRVPLRKYSEFQPYVDRIAAGEQNVLTRERVILFEPTGGSTSGSKLIPYTRTLQEEFQRGINAWIANLFLHDPRLLSGRAYWSLSPLLGIPTTTPGGIPVGFETDSDYLGSWQRRLARSLMAVPPSVHRIEDIETSRYVSLLFLLRCPDLRLISVWNPTFLELLVERLREWGDELARDLERGFISRLLPSSIPSSLSTEPRRSRELKAALRSVNPADLHARLWPKLRLISCWADANASSAAARLRDVFPQARVQGKGLIATEGFISLPLEEAAAPALSYRSHFFEFLPLDSSGRATSSAICAHELSVGETYAIVLTTGGGLYRYELEDLVEVVGKIEDCPLLQFMGRQHFVADWFGEKLHENHVRDAIESACSSYSIVPEFAMLACEMNPRPAYVLFLESTAPAELFNGVANVLEHGLRKNVHYRYARSLGQLDGVRVLSVRAGARRYIARCIEEGQRAGDIKPVALDCRSGWARYFGTVNQLGSRSVLSQLQ